jgi:hypothetical protein
MSALAAPSVQFPRRQSEAPTSGIEELVRLAETESYELVDGKLVEKEMAFLSGDVTTEIVIALAGFVKSRKLGKLVVEGAASRSH